MYTGQVMGSKWSRLHDMQPFLSLRWILRSRIHGGSGRGLCSKFVAERDDMMINAQFERLCTCQSGRPCGPSIYFN